MTLLLSLLACSKVCWFDQCVQGEPREPGAAGPDTASGTSPDPTETPPTPTDCPPDSPHTWLSTGAPFIRSHCLGCHSSALEGAARAGAPVGIDFDTLEQVRAWADRIEALTLDETPTMPPAGGPTPGELAAFAEWVACELPGEDAPQPEDPCEAAPTLSAADFAGCDQPVHVEGDLRLDRADDLTCLCSVDGSLILTSGGEASRLTLVSQDLVVEGAAAGDLSLPKLTLVGGALQATAPDLISFQAPVLDAVVSGVHFEGASRLTQLDAGRLRFVGGELALTDLTALPSFQLGSVDEVARGVTLARNEALTQASLRSLVTVGTAVLIEDNPQLTSLEDWGALTNVPADFIVRRCERLATLRGLNALTRVGGALWVEANPALTTVEGFEVLDYAGNLSLQLNDALTSLSGFEATTALGGLQVVNNPRLVNTPRWRLLTTVEGEVLVQGNTRLTEWDLPVVQADRLLFADLPALQSLHLDELESADALTVDTLPVLEDLGVDRLEVLTGGLVLRALGRLTEFGGLSRLEQVGGDLWVLENPALLRLDGLSALHTVRGDLRIQDNPYLPTLDAEGFAGGISVGGSVQIRNNGS